MIFKKVIVADLDGTLAPSKSKVEPEMAEVLCKLLSKHYLAVVSGGGFPQFEKQFLSGLNCPPECLKNLSLFPTMGSTCYLFDVETNSWKQIYDEPLPLEDRQKIISALNDAILESGVDVSGASGPLIEDRHTQITFSGKGQDAPPDVKKGWDIDKSKRMKIVSLLKEKIPQFEMSVNANTSIDITRLGLDKSYAITKIKEILHITDDDIIFVGDALFVGGNDAPIKKTDVDYIQESNPEETMEFLRQYI